MSATPVVCLIQGASRGIGLQFCKTLLQRHPQCSVIATCRNTSDVNSSLFNFQTRNQSRIDICKLDVTNEDDISNVMTFTKEKYGKLDLLINSAGMLHPSGRGETSLKDVSLEVRFVFVFRYNSYSIVY